ncbi:MAG TPA: YheU family protein [Steroidobacteraceae bacterium]|nr:YheU family protein [Steroidobacteraceae bacterium]
MADSFDDPRERPSPVEVPPSELSPDALRGVIESFVLREGTDYGERDVSHEAKVTQVQRQLERGEAKILFDPATESIDIVVTRPAGRRTPGV